MLMQAQSDILNRHVEEKIQLFLGEQEHVRTVEYASTSEPLTGRFYHHTQKDLTYPSVTTVLGYFYNHKFEEWRKAVGDERADEVSTRAKNVGNALHLYAENYCTGTMKNSMINMHNPIIKDMFSKIKHYIDESLIITSPVHTEFSVFNEKFQVAGRVDMAAVWEDQWRVVDFKTSSRYKKPEEILNYYMQSAVYADALGIDKFVILMSVTDEYTGEIYHGTTAKYLKAFSLLREKYREIHGV